MLQFQEKHIELVRNILKEHLNTQSVFVFGSRAVNQAKTFSDLDLCIEGEKLSFFELSKLKDAFSESDLPYFVDIIQKENISDEFYTLIKPNFIELTL